MGTPLMPTNPMQPVVKALQPTVKPQSPSMPLPLPEPVPDPSTVPAHSHQEREFARKLIAAGAPASPALKKEAEAIGYDEDYDSSNETFLDRVFHTSH